ncbi:MAG: class I SAM-dependent methyltransferase [Kiritimatiellales bacterium]|nr:class I SAM-dependent methyltransferase [Kiritimatiellales bacterium]
MKRYGNLIAGLIIVLAGLSAILACAAEPDTTSAEFRNAFLAEYKHAGMDSTAGDAMMLRILVESANLKRGIEVGSFKGFGAMNMGIAFERTGGKLFTVEIDPERVKETRGNLKKLGLEKSVECIEGDALEVLPTLKGEYDFLFMDALKGDYMKYFKVVEPKLKVGSVIVADNVIKSERAMKDFLDYIQNSPDYDTVIIRASMEKNDGMLVSYKIR